MTLQAIRWRGRTHFGYVHNTGTCLVVTEHEFTKYTLMSVISRRRYFSQNRYSVEECVHLCLKLVEKWINEADR